MKKWLFLVFVLLVFVTACAMKETSEKATLVNVNQPVAMKDQTISTQPIIFGLWNADQMFIFDPKTSDLEETQLSVPSYVEFKENKMCEVWVPAEPHCTQYDNYTLSGNIIQIVQEGNTNESEWHYEWLINNSKLELTAVSAGEKVMKTIYSKTTPEQVIATLQTEVNQSE